MYEMKAHNNNRQPQNNAHTYTQQLVITETKVVAFEQVIRNSVSYFSYF